MTTQVARARALPATTTRRPARDTLAGFGPMLRLIGRRNRVRLAVWLAVVVGLVGYVGPYYRDMFPTQQALDDFAVLSDTPGIRALTGLAADPATLGGAVWTKIWMCVAIALALGVAFLVTRNGRADEEAGRTELLRSRELGLHAGSAAAWTWIAAVCVVAGIGVAAVSAAVPLDPAGDGVVGSLVFGASVTGVGLFGLGVGAVAGQVTATSRGANALASIVIVAFYVVRMVGDLGDGTLTWASPIGWGQEMQPWGANRWWPLVLLLALTAALLAVAWAIEARRDHGSGLLPERLGKASAPARYATPLGLGLRLQRGPIIGWTLAILITALLFGSVVESMADLIADADGAVTDLLGGTGVQALVSMLISMIALIVAIFAVQSACSLRTDEAAGIIEPQLATATSRTSWALQRLAIPTVGSAALLAAGGAVFGATYGAVTGDATQAGLLMGAALAYWPAVMVLVGITVVLFGWLPRLAVPLSWGVVAAIWFVMIIGDALYLPDWVGDALPWSATPYQPLEEMRWTPVVVMGLIALALVTLGLGRFRTRDVQPG